MNKVKEKILENLKNTYCRIKTSNVDKGGVGIFAIRDIPKNTDPFYGAPNQVWREFKISELKRIDKEVMKMIDDFFVIEKDKTVYVPDGGLNAMNISYFLNNSQKPNVKTIDNGKNFITIRRIKKGEELTSSYKTYDEKYF